MTLPKVMKACGSTSLITRNRMPVSFFRQTTMTTFVGVFVYQPSPSSSVTPRCISLKMRSAI